MNKKLVLLILGSLCVVAGAVSAELSPRVPVAEVAMDSAEVDLPALSPLSQYQLIRALAVAERDADDVGAALARVRRDWQGRRYRWRAYVVGSLCATPNACNVLVTDRLGADRDVVVGWMPRLHLSGVAHRRLAAGCAGPGRCEIRFEGTMS
ncbi:MAG: hypothetical protein KJO07_18085, partial [Deltaproteobacteria bacterium]|nr:hypothetical protein [Deltaproteobacteria bacterium]